VEGKRGQTEGRRGVQGLRTFGQVPRAVLNILVIDSSKNLRRTQAKKKRMLLIKSPREKQLQPRNRTNEGEINRNKERIDF